jgi:hypothetical protein
LLDVACDDVRMEMCRRHCVSSTVVGFFCHAVIKRFSLGVIRLGVVHISN